MPIMAACHPTKTNHARGLCCACYIKLRRTEVQGKISKTEKKYREINRDKILKRKKEERLNNPEKFKARDKEKYNKHREKTLEKLRIRYENNPDKYKKRAMEYHRLNPLRRRNGRLIAKYELSHTQYEERLLSQGGRCAICGAVKSGRKDGFFAIDHDHKTGIVRGILCIRCNNGLGYIENAKMLKSALKYLKVWKQNKSLKGNGEQCVQQKLEL